jgi:ABC-type molybdenum transport system ATPase subunit/photorepair protein PhrA
MRHVMVIGCGGSGKSTLARSPKKHRPRMVSAIERLGAHLRLIQLFRDRDGEIFLATVGTA